MGELSVALSTLSEAARRAAETMHSFGRVILFHGREQPKRYRRSVHRAYRRAGIEPPVRTRWKVVYGGTEAR